MLADVSYYPEFPYTLILKLAAGMTCTWLALLCQAEGACTQHSVGRAGQRAGLGSQSLASKDS
jgi:hypothetical protein